MRGERCPWSALVIIGIEVDNKHLHYVRCKKRNRWYSKWLRAWHLHDAELPSCIAGQATIGIRWRSSNSADYHYQDVMEDSLSE